jgi:hypothetical protein
MEVVKITYKCILSSNILYGDHLKIILQFLNGPCKSDFKCFQWQWYNIEILADIYFDFLMTRNFFLNWWHVISKYTKPSHIYFGRVKRYYSIQNLIELFKKKGLDPNELIMGEEQGELPLYVFDDKLFETRTPSKW